MIIKQRLNRVCVSAAALMLAAGCSVPDTGSAPVRELLKSGGERITYSELPDRPLHFFHQYLWNVWDSGGEYLFNEIADVAGGTGSFFLLDSGNKQVVKLAPDGNLLDSFSRFGSGPGELNYPLHMTFHGNDLWVSDVGNRRFSIYSPEGAYIKDIRWPGASRLVNPFSITEAGRILHGGMWPLTAESRARIPFARQMPAIKGIALDREGRIWVEVNTPEPGITRLDVFNSSGDYLGYLGRLPLPDAFSTDGNILIRGTTGDGLDRFEVGTVGWSDSGISPGH